MLRKFLLGTVAALGVVGASAVAQQWLNYPEVGGNSFCSSTVNSTCVNTVPAGPGLTGLETIPGDTNKAGGAAPQTVKIPVALLGGGVENNVPVLNDTVIVTPGVGRLILTPAGTLAALTIGLPAATQLYDGQTLYIVSTQNVTVLDIVAGTGTTIATSTTSLTANTPVRYTYSADNTKWIKG